MNVRTACGLALTASLTLSSGAANAWWACPSGMTMELRNSNTEVRRHTPAQYRGHDACPLATAAGGAAPNVRR